MNAKSTGPVVALSAEDKRALLASLLRSQANRQSAIWPLSPGQKALWFLHCSAPDSPAYHVSFSARIHSVLDTAALKRAMQRIVDRHPQLRATFKVVDGQPVQSIAPERELSFTVHATEGDDEDVLRHKIEAAYRKPFDLAQGPLFRVDLFKAGHHDHVLLITVHHIVYDAWSLWVNLDELRELYGAELQGKAAALPALASNYDEFARSLQGHLDSPQGEQDWAFWREQLSGDLPVLNLPIDHPRPPVQSLQGASHAFALDAGLTSQLKALAQARGVTLFMLLLAAYQVLLSRYSGQKDILVGSPVTGRTHPSVFNVVGYFVNPVVLRARLEGAPAFVDFLDQVRQTVIGSLEHQSMPFPVIVERLNPPRDSSVSPVCQVSFVLQKERKGGGMIESVAGSDSSGVFDWGGLSMSYFDLPQQEGQFDLELELMDSGSTLFGSLKYNRELFEPATIDRLGLNFKRLLLSIVENPQGQVDQLRMLDEAERDLVLRGWNDTATDYPFLGWMPDLVAQQAQRSPEAIAVRFEQTALTYADFVAQVNRLANHLVGAGVRADVVVGVCLERSIDMVVALHAIQKAGGAYLPLDPQYPPDRLAYMANDAGIALLISHSQLRESCVGVTAPRLDLDLAHADLATSPDTAPHVTIEADDLAYVIYTSGSTGRPKGVAVPHRGFLNRLQWMQEQYRLKPSDTVLQKTPFSFDVSVWEFFWPLMSGATLAVALPGDHRDAGRVVETIKAHGVTALHFVPSMLQVFLGHAEAASCDTVKQVFCSGEALPFNLQQRFFEVMDTPQLHNLYGPTEASIDVSHWTCQRHALTPVVPIGVPIANTSLHVLDEHLNPVPIGVAGELHIGGVGLARGYLNRPELTQEKFIQDPFGHARGDRLYKTGDLARFRADGAIEYLGRLDHQVKLRGFRIEIGEIESVLVEHPAVEATVVTVHESQGDKRLVAYLACGDHERPSVGDLRDFLGTRLPDHMIPSLFVMLEAMPLGPNGKVNRHALPSPEVVRSGPDTEYVAPRSNLERDMALLWQQTLGLEQVGVKDNFFQLGGHSLLAVGLMTRIEQTFGPTLPTSTLFRNPTVELLSQAVQAHTAGAAVSTLVPIQTEGDQPPLFCPAGGGGSVLYYQPLAKYLGPSQPFYGLQAVGLDGLCEPLRDIESMAALYIQEIRGVQPKGPYRIAGHCFGGLVAFEMAQQLRRAGEEIETLMLIDVPARQLPGQLPTDDLAWLLKLADVIRESSGQDLGLKEDELRGLDATQQLLAFRQAMVSAQVLPEGAGTAQVRGLLRVFATNGAMKYAPSDVRPLPIVVFRATEFHPDYDFTSADDAGAPPEKSSMGWQDHASQPVETVMVPGNHITMMSEPHVSELARRMRSSLDRLRAVEMS
jgi:amino acid adenylation domain-containing protein